jgi:hypothetical protein
MRTFLLIILLLAPAVRAGEAENLLRQARRQFEGRGLWEIFFEQQVLPGAGGDTLRSSGRLLACPDGAFRVDMEGLHLLSDGRDLWRWEDGGSQVLMERVGQSEDVLLPHQMLILVEERFRPTGIRSQGAERRIIRLQPRSGSEFLRDVTLIMTREKGQWWPREISFTDFADARVRFLVQRRESWPDRGPRREQLVFKLPGGMEVVDLRSGDPDATR